jgi:hypothetical protein
MSEFADLQPIVTTPSEPAAEEGRAGTADVHQIVRTIGVVVAAVALVVIAAMQLQISRHEAETACAQRAIYQRSVGTTGAATNATAIQQQLADCFK